MDGHVPTHPGWRSAMERKLNRLVFETENGGLMIENDRGMDSLTAGDGSEQHADDESSNADDVAELQDGMKSGKYALESSGFLESRSAMTPLQEWHQHMDVFGVRRFSSALGSSVTVVEQDRLPRLINSASNNGLEVWYGFVPQCCFRDIKLMYRGWWESINALRSSDDGLETSGRGRMIFKRCQSIGDAEYQIRQDRATTASLKRELETRRPMGEFQHEVVTYMGKDPILPYYVYQVHVTRSTNTYAIRRVQRMPAPCTATSVGWMLSYALELSDTETMDMLGTLSSNLGGNEGLRLLEQKNYETNDDVDRMEVFDALYNALRSLSRTLLDRGLKTLNDAGAASSGREAEPGTDGALSGNGLLGLINDSDAIKLPHVTFLKHSEITRFFGGKRFTVLARYFDARWLSKLNVHQLDTLYERAHTRPFDVCFPGKKAWLEQSIMNGDSRGRGGIPEPPAFARAEPEGIFVPEITLASCASIHLDMLCLRHYSNHVLQAPYDLDCEPTFARHFAYVENSRRYADYVADCVGTFNGHGSESLFTQLCAYELTRALQKQGNHVYMHLDTITGAMRDSTHCQLCALIILGGSGVNTAHSGIFSKAKVLEALHCLSDGVPRGANYKKLIVLALPEDGVDGAPVNCRDDDARTKRLRQLKSRSPHVKVYLLHLYEREAMMLFVCRVVAERRVAQHLAGSIPPLRTRTSQNPRDHERFRHENCSEQQHVEAHLDAHRPFINLNGSGGGGKTQCLKMVNQELGARNVLQCSFMSTHKQTLMNRVGPQSRGATIHRTMVLHSMTCKSANTCKYMSMLKKAQFNVRVMKYLDTLFRSYKQQERNSDLTLLSMGWNTCGFEDVTTLVVEEAGVTNSQQLISIMWMLYRCAPNFSCVITAGDTNQLPSIEGDDVQGALIAGFGECRFSHVHRFKDRVLRSNADAIKNQNTLDICAQNIPLFAQHTFANESTVFDPRATLSRGPARKRLRAIGMADNRDTAVFQLEHYQSGVFHVAMDPECMKQACELLIYRLGLTPETCQFIMRTNAEVASMRHTIRCALISTARAKQCGMDPQVYALRNYGTKSQIASFERATTTGSDFGHAPRSMLLVFSRDNDARSAETTDSTYDLLESSLQDNHGSKQYDPSGRERLDAPDVLVAGQIIQTTRNVPSLDLNNLDRMQMVCCLQVRFELINDEWDPLAEDIISRVNAFDGFTQLNGDDAHDRAARVLHQGPAHRAGLMMFQNFAATNGARGNDDLAEFQRSIVPDEERNQTTQLYGDRQWALEQLNSLSVQIRELDSARHQRRGASGDNDDGDAGSDSDGDDNRIPGEQYSLERESEGLNNYAPSTFERVPNSTTSAHDWFAPAARMYLFTAVACGTVSLEYAAQMIFDECTRRCEENGNTCVLCAHSSPDCLYLDAIPEDIKRKLLKGRRGKGKNKLLTIMELIDAKMLKLRVVKIQRTNRWDRTLALKHAPTETPAFRILMARDVSDLETQGELTRWIHSGVSTQDWSESRARALLRGETNNVAPATHQSHRAAPSDLSTVTAKYIPYEGSMCQLARDGACITYHAMQGAQYPTIVCTMPRASKFCTHKHIYSGSTRSTTRLIYAGSMSAIKRAVATDDPVRNSNLGNLLRALVADALDLENVMPVNRRAAAVAELAENERYGKLEHSIAERYMLDPAMQTDHARAALEADVMAYEREHRAIVARRVSDAANKRAAERADASGSDDEDDDDQMQIMEQLGADMGFLARIDKNAANFLEALQKCTTATAAEEQELHQVRIGVKRKINHASAAATDSSTGSSTSSGSIDSAL